MLLLPLLMACGPRIDDNTANPSEDDGISDVAARLSTGTSTAILVSWAATGGEAWVEFGPDDTYGGVAAEDAPGVATLVGNTAATDVHYRVGAEVDGAVVYSDDQVITTGALPESVPVAPTEVSGDTAWGQWILTSYIHIDTGATGLEIFNADGDVVWYHEGEPGLITAARPTADGKAIQWMWVQGQSDENTAQICTVSLLGENESCVPTPQAHHDFYAMDDGSLVYLASYTESWEGLRLKGDRLVQQAADGSTTILWNAFDDITPVPTDLWNPDPGAEIDWTHCNGLWRDEPTGDWVISAFLLYDIRRVSGSTGQTEWVLGGATSDFTISGAGFGPQHAPQLVDGGIWMFDNAGGTRPSRAVEYTLDESTFTATEAVSYTHPDNLHSIAMGEANLTPNGYLAVGFGELGDLGVWSPTGERVLWWDAPLAIATGQVYLFDDLYAMGQ